MKRTFVALALLAAAVTARAADPVIPEKDLVVNGDITLELPALGESRPSAVQHPKKPQMVAMEAQLPSNWERKRPMPVLCVYRGWDGSGGAYGQWNKLMGGVNFITLTVDFNAGGGDGGFANMLYALKVLEKATAIDRSSLVVVGDNGGAWMVAKQFLDDHTFCAAAVVSGGGPNEVRGLAGRPMLILANPADMGGKNENQPLTNFDREVELFELIKKSGGSAELIVGDKINGWHEHYGPRIRDWIHAVVPNPDIKRAYWLDRELGWTRDDARQQWLRQQLVDSWVEMPRTADARKKLNSARN
jgi:hypothetical protein